MGDFTIAPTASEKADFKKPMKGLKIEGKAMGYSTFPREIFPVPKAWAEKTGDLVFYRLNEKGESLCMVLNVASELIVLVVKGATLRDVRIPSCWPRILQSFWRLRCAGKRVSCRSGRRV